MGQNEEAGARQGTRHKPVVPAKAGTRNPRQPARAFPGDFLGSGLRRNDGGVCS